MGKKSNKYEKKYGKGVVRRVGSDTTPTKPPASSPGSDPEELKAWLEKRIGHTLSRTFKTGLDAKAKNYLYARCFKMKIVSVDEFVELSIVSYDLDELAGRIDIHGKELGRFSVPIEDGGAFGVMDAGMKACEPKFYKKYRKAA